MILSFFKEKLDEKVDMEKRSGSHARTGFGIQIPLNGLIPMQATYAYTARSATINASSLNVRSGPGTSYSKTSSLTRGTAVTVLNETTGSDGRLWYQIRFSKGSGYVLSTYVKFPVSYSHDGDFEAYLSAQGFPESYKTGLRQLHAQYPNWVFTAQNTGLDWNTVIENESVLGRNLVHTNSISSYKSLVDGAYNWDSGVWTGFDGSTWVAASEDVICYYMDPRNFLDEVSVFQFLDQTYDANLHTKDGLQSMLKGTFMEGAVSGTTNSSGSSGSSNSSNSSGSTGSSSGLSSGGPGVSSGSSGSSSSGSLSSGGPGVSSGSSGSLNSGSLSSAKPEVSLSGPGSSPTVTPGGQGAVLTKPSGSGSSSQNGISFTAPTKSSKEVELVSPQASVSKKETFLVGTSVLTVGPSASDSSSVSVAAALGSTTASDGTQSYADILMQAAAQSGVNPYVLAAMIIQEQGSNGRGNSISGNYSGYRGYYNHFNVGAYAYNGMSAVERGLWYASQSGSYGRPWNSIYSSIVGGSQFYGSNYVSAGQDTLYLKKFNVQGSNMYKHQYMTNVDGAASEGSIFAEGFSSQLKATALEFKIPVYKNMPETACAKPTRDGSPNNKLSSLGVNGFALTPTFNKNTTSYDLIVDNSVSEVSVYANVIDSKASVSGTGTIALHSGINEIRVEVKAQNGDEREYVIRVVRQNNGPTYNAGLGTGTSGASGTGGTISIGPNVSSSGTGSSSVSSSGPGAASSGVTSSSPTPSGGSTVTLIGPGG